MTHIKLPQMTLEQAIEYAKTSGGVRFLVTPEQIAEIRAYAVEHGLFMIPENAFAVSIEPSPQRPIDFLYWESDEFTWKDSNLPEITLVTENNQTNKHPLAELMLQYAKDAMETTKPWERWECCWQPQVTNPVWSACVEHPVWQSEFIYRRKPKTININSFEVPEPLREIPNLGKAGISESVYLPSLSDNLTCSMLVSNSYTKVFLDLGLCHSTKEAAELHAKALLSFTTLEK